MKRFFTFAKRYWRGAAWLLAVATIAFTINLSRQVSQERVEVRDAAVTGSPCRSALREALIAAGLPINGALSRRDVPGSVLKNVLVDQRCAAQSDLVLWSYCIRYPLIQRSSHLAAVTRVGICDTTPASIRPSEKGVVVGGGNNPSGQPGGG